MKRKSGRQADGSIITRAGNRYSAHEWGEMQAQREAEAAELDAMESRIEEIEGEAIARFATAGVPLATARKLVYSITRPDPFRPAPPIQFSSAESRAKFQPIIDWLNTQARSL